MILRLVNRMVQDPSGSHTKSRMRLTNGQAFSVPERTGPERAQGLEDTVREKTGAAWHILRCSCKIARGTGAGNAQSDERAPSKPDYRPNNLISSSYRDVTAFLLC